MMSCLLLPWQLAPPPREEQEKLNVWVALMNLENLYGTQNSLMKVFESALQQNEPIEVFFRLAAIYEQSKKLDVGNGRIQWKNKTYVDMCRRDFTGPLRVTCSVVFYHAPDNFGYKGYCEQ